MDYRKSQRGGHSPIHIDGEEVERVRSYKYTSLRTHHLALHDIYESRCLRKATLTLPAHHLSASMPPSRHLRSTRLRNSFHLQAISLLNSHLALQHIIMATSDTVTSTSVFSLRSTYYFQYLFYFLYLFYCYLSTLTQDSHLFVYFPLFVFIVFICPAYSSK